MQVTTTDRTTGMGASSRAVINRLCAMRESEAEENSDEKVLGSGEFVDRLLAEAEEKIKRQLPPCALTRRFRGIVEKACARGKITRDIH